MDDVFQKLNMVLQNPTIENILSVFEVDGYIRLNMIYISHITLKQFKAKLAMYDLIDMYISNKGMGFVFKTFKLSFHGLINVAIRNKIFRLEIDFDPFIDENCGVSVMNDIEAYLKHCDAIFFMTYGCDIDKEILHNPLEQSVDFLYKRSLHKKQQQ